MGPTLGARAEAAWARLRTYASRRYPDRSGPASFDPPASQVALDTLASNLGHPLPDELRAVYSVHDGSKVPLLPQGACLRSVKQMTEDWSTFALLADEMYLDEPPRLVDSGSHLDSLYDRGWIPFGTREDFELFVDLVPGPTGTRGQVLLQTDEASVAVVGRDLLSFLERWAALLDSAELCWSDGLGYPLPAGGVSFAKLLERDLGRAGRPRRR